MPTDDDASSAVVLATKRLSLETNVAVTTNELSLKPKRVFCCCCLPLFLLLLLRKNEDDDKEEGVV